MTGMHMKAMEGIRRNYKAAFKRIEQMQEDESRRKKEIE